VSRPTLHVQPGFQVPGRERCFSGTPFAIKVQRALHWKGIAFDVHEVAWPEREALFARIGPARKLPILEEPDGAVEDSGEILRHLEQTHPEPSLLPAAPRDRALALFVEEWADEVFYFQSVYEVAHVSGSAVQARAYHGPGLSDAEIEAGNRAAIRMLEVQGTGRYAPEKVLGDLERALDALVVLLRETGFVAGPRLGHADLALFGHFHRRCAGTHPEIERRIRARPALVGHMERVDALTRGPS